MARLAREDVGAFARMLDFGIRLMLDRALENHIAHAAIPRLFP